MNNSLRDRVHVYKTHIRQSSYNSLIVQNILKLVEMEILKYFHSLNWNLTANISENKMKNTAVANLNQHCTEQVFID